MRTRAPVPDVPALGMTCTLGVRLLSKVAKSGTTELCTIESALIVDTTFPISLTRCSPVAVTVTASSDTATGARVNSTVTVSPAATVTC